MYNRKVNQSMNQSINKRSDRLLCRLYTIHRDNPWNCNGRSTKLAHPLRHDDSSKKKRRRNLLRDRVDSSSVARFACSPLHGRWQKTNPFPRGRGIRYMSHIIGRRAVHPTGMLFHCRLFLMKRNSPGSVQSRTFRRVSIRKLSRGEIFGVQDCQTTTNNPRPNSPQSGRGDRERRYPRRQV